MNDENGNKGGASGYVLYISIYVDCSPLSTSHAFRKRFSCRGLSIFASYQIDVLACRDVVIAARLSLGNGENRESIGVGVEQGVLSLN